MISSPSFCVRPFNHIQVKNNGYLTFCCDANPGYILNAQGKQLKANQASQADIKKSAQLKEIKEKMLKGERPNECKKCWETEDAGGHSLRLVSNAAWGKKESRGDALLFVELRLGNLCNLKCRMCGPGNSSKWYDDYNKLYGSTRYKEYGEVFDFSKDLDLFSWHEEEGMISWFQQIAPEVQEIQLAGGEPLLSKSHIPLLEKLIELNLSSQISLRYTTNLTVLKKEFFEIWKKFREVSINVSLDGIGETYEYIRYPAKWDTIEKNLIELNQQIGKGVTRASILPTLNIYNIFNLQPLAIWYLKNLDKIFWTSYLNFQEGPMWQSAYILQNDTRLSLAEKLYIFAETIAHGHDSFSREHSVKVWVDGIAARLLVKDWSYLRSTFLRYNSILDKERKQNLHRSIPNLKDFL